MGVVNVPVQEGIKALLFGLVLGVSGYLAGYAMSIESQTFLQMIGLNGYITTNIDKNYDHLSDMYEAVPSSMYAMETLQQLSPFLFVMVLDSLLIAAGGIAYRNGYLVMMSQE